jgi:TfoX/Sxy family transcriptional regulator of competence genes
MAFDEQFAERVRKEVNCKRGVVEKKMFGGLAFLVNGNMSVGIYKNELIVRMAPQDTAAALKEPGARRFNVTRRPMKGWVMVERAGVRHPASLAKWVRRGVAFASSLPKK